MKIDAIKPGAYVLTGDIENPKPHKNRRDWYSHPVWKAGMVFLVYVTTEYRGPRENRVKVLKMRPRREGNYPTELTLAVEDFEYVEDDPRWKELALALVTMSHFAPSDDLNDQVKALTYQLGELESAASYVLERAVDGLLRSGKISMNDIATAYREEYARETAEYEREEAAKKAAEGVK